MAQVFISFARETEAAARIAAEALRVHGHSAWLDEQLPAHREYADVISEKLDAADAVLVIWSEPATRSQWVRAEANRARERDRLVQFRIDQAQLPLPFDQVQCVDLSGWAGETIAPGWQTILSSIEELDRNAGSIAEHKRTSGPRARSLAVVQFRDLSPAGDEGYFCEGICEEITMALARLPQLSVASPTATSQADAPLSSREMAKILGVDSFLEGSVRKRGNRVKVAVRLVETATGFAIWAETFDRELGDAFALQEEIARAVVDALGLKLLTADDTYLGQGGTNDPAAYDLYLKGRHQVRQELESERRAAAGLFREATRRDPQFALAYAALAEVLVQLARWRLPDWRSMEKEAIGAAKRAVALAPSLADTHLALGGALHLRHDPAACDELLRAVELSPHDCNVHYRYARYLVVEGRKKEAIAEYERAFELAPDDYRYVVLTLQEYQALGDKEGERSALERSWLAIQRHVELNPHDVRAIGHGAGVLAVMGDKAGAEEFIQRALTLRPDDYGNLATLACAAMLNHDAEAALDLLERAAATGRGDKEWLLQGNDLVPLHGHPRFKAIVARMS